MSHKATEDLKNALKAGDAAITAANGAIAASVTAMNDAIVADGGTGAIYVSFISSALGSMSAPGGDIDLSIGKFANYMIDHGKDMILVSDQADQFVCIANDTFSRIVDVYGTLQSDFATPYVLSITNVINKLTDIKTYIDSRIGETSTSGVTDTQNQIDTLNQIAVDAYNALLLILSDSSELYNRSALTLDLFKEVLLVNSVVGIALSLSKQGYQELVVMNQLYYKIDNEKLPDVIVDDAVDSTIFNSNDIIFKEDQKRLLKLLTASLLNHHDYVDSTGTVRVALALDTMPLAVEIPKNLLEFKSAPEDIVANKPAFNLFDDLFKAITFAEYLQNESKISDAGLQTYYNTLSDPLISFDDFKIQFVDINAKLLDFVGGVNAKIVANSVSDLQLHQNWKMLKDLISLRGSIAYPLEPKIFEGIEYFNGSLSENSDYYNDYMRLLYNTYSVSTEFYDTYNQYDVLFNFNYQSEELTVSSRSGNCIVSRFDGFGADEKLVEMVAKYPFRTKFYSDSIGIVYAEAQIGNNSIILKDNVLYTTYKTMDVDHFTSTEINTSRKDIILGYKMSGYLSNEDANLSLTKQYLKIVDDNVLNASATGIKTTSKITTEIEGDGAGAFTLHKETVAEVDTIIYTNDYNTVERIVTNITNVYREKLINKEIDFTEARLKSILGSLDYLNYQKKFDDYIDYTWTAGVPRLVREH